MKKFIGLVAALFVSFSVVADEGMWLLPYLQKLNIKEMKAKGLKLSAEDIYNVNGSSLKDAIVVFGGGCTGEIVSPEGLIFTNHHCGYDAIQKLSTVEHNWLQDGFWAMNRAEELPAEGLEVRFIRRIEEVTDRVLGNVPDNSGEEERQRIVAENIEALEKELREVYPQYNEVWVRSFFGGNQYFAFLIDVYRDVRLVGTPPSAIGKFGGDTDNWMWPRHTGDFSVFRVYADRDGRPADYSPENVPLHTDAYLKVSLKGYKPGDYAMIMGFPGSTERYMTSWEVDKLTQVENPVRIDVRGERQRILMEDMEADPKILLQYASKYASSSNYWKNSIGKNKGLAKLNVRAQKEAEEAEFAAWAADCPQYERALPLIRESVQNMASYEHDVQYLAEAILSGVELSGAASRILSKLTVNPDSVSQSELVAALREASEGFYKDYSEPTDRRVAKRMLEMVRDNVSPERLPAFYAARIDSLFGGDIAAYVDWVYDNSALSSQEKLLAAVQQADTTGLKWLVEDPAVELYNNAAEVYIDLYNALAPYRVQYNEGHRLYLAGLQVMQPERKFYPDANFTLRLTYGSVLPYSPADGIEYDYYTTLRGVMEKEDPSNPIEFSVPEKLKELYEAGDYGQYGFVPRKGEKPVLPVAFLTNNDITGGNSGSPVLNARGELIGLAFDGNWEAMSGDIAFEPDLQRTICVDARYVLFIIDRFGGAGHLLDEMTIVK